MFFIRTYSYHRWFTFRRVDDETVLEGVFSKVYTLGVPEYIPECLGVLGYKNISALGVPGYIPECLGVPGYKAYTYALGVLGCILACLGLPGYKVYIH